MFGLNNNPHNLPKRHFTAHVGLYSSFSAFVLFYEHSIEKLFSDVSEGHGTPDMIAIPLLFLMRHAMELGYKFSLVHLCRLNSNPFTPEKPGGEEHSLTKLHKRLGMEFSEAEKHDRVSAKDREAFDEYYAVTEKKMLIFDKLDPRSVNLRFPESDETPVFPRGTKINLLDLKNAFDEAMILLGTVVDVIARPGRYYG